MSLARPSIAFDNSPNEAGFFDRERDRLIEEISTVSHPLLKSQVRADIQSFEGLMAHTNVLNRKLEEVHGVGKEFTTVADLWGVSLVLVLEWN